MTHFNRFGEPEMSDAKLFKLLHRALAKPPRLILQKSLALVGMKPKATKPAKPAPKSPVPVIVRKPQPSDRELAAFLGDATVRGLLTGSAAHDAQQAANAGGKMPPQVRAVLLLLRAYGGKSGK